MSHRANAPDAGRLAEKAIAIRASRASRRENLPAHILGEPAWDILLVLAELRGSGQPACPERLAEEISQPITATLRWLQELGRYDLITREAEGATVQLSDKGTKALERALDNFA